MDKEELEKKLEKLEIMLENHNQDVRELTFVIEGLRNQIKMEEENNEETDEEELNLEEE